MRPFQAQAEALKRQLTEEMHERAVLNAKMQADMKKADDFTSDTSVKQVKVRLLAVFSLLLNTFALPRAVMLFVYEWGV